VKSPSFVLASRSRDTTPLGTTGPLMGTTSRVPSLLIESRSPSNPTRSDCPLWRIYARGETVLVGAVCDDSGVKRATAISRLLDVVDGLDRTAQWPETTLVAAFVFGAPLDSETNPEHVQLAFVVAPLASDCRVPRSR
jgi:hypothetical protein